MTQRFYTAEGIILKQQHLGEADQLLTLYTPTLGKLRIVARGARRIRSKVGGHVEPLTRVLVSLNQGRTLDVVGQVQTLESHRHLRIDLELITTAIHFADLIDNFTSDANPNSSLYFLLNHALGWLGKQGTIEILTIFFKFHLLRLSGYLPELQKCVECSLELKEGHHRYYPSGGGVICTMCHPEHGGILPISVGCLKVLRFINTRNYEDIAQIKLSLPLGKELQRLLDASIHYILEREIKTTSFLQHVQNMAR